MLGVGMMSQVPRMLGYTIVSFICGCLQDSWESLRGRDKREQPGAPGRGPCLPDPHTHHLSLDFLLYSWLRGPGPFGAPALVTWLEWEWGSSLEPS